jgi:RING finger protein 170
MRLLQQLRIWGLMLGGLLYLLSPLDVLPEGLFGLIGLLDDVMVLVVLGIMVAGVFRNVMLQRAAQAM